MRWVTRSAFAAVVSLGLVNGTQSASAQVLMAAPETSAVTVAALTAPELARANDLITRMVQSRELIASDVRDDVTIPGRRHETYRQFYRGVPVEGSSVTRQMAGATTVSAFGTIHTGIAIDVTPSLTPTDASRVIEREAGRPLAFGIAPVLVILPSPLGSYALTYRATVADAITYYVDALSGDVLKVVDEKKDDVGVHG